MLAAFVRLRRLHDPQGEGVFLALRYGGFTPMNRSDAIEPTNQKPRSYPPVMRSPLDTLAGVRGEMARLYRLGLNGRIRSDEITRFIYALKEIRACLEAEILTDVQQRLALLSREMDNHNGHRVLHQPTFAGS